VEPDDTYSPAFDPAERFCPRCLAMRPGDAQSICEKCGLPMLPLNDADGALSHAYLHARGFCCDSGCRNCPWNDG